MKAPAQPNMTTDQLIDGSIAAELKARTLYLELARRFERHPEVARYWNDFATEEQSHASWLRRLKERTAPERLAAPADPAMAKLVELESAMVVDDLLKSVTNLNEAHGLASELESGETNRVFDFLIREFAGDETTRRFLKSLLSDHVARLVSNLPPEMETAAGRMQIKAASR
jgi:rubrerythrin